MNETPVIDWTGWEEQTDYEDWYRAERLWDNTVERALIYNPNNPSHLYELEDGGHVIQCEDMRVRVSAKKGVPRRYYIYQGDPEPEGLVQQYITFTPIAKARQHLHTEHKYLALLFDGSVTELVYEGGENNWSEWSIAGEYRMSEEQVKGVALMPLPKENT